jgi:hypothetical protein
VQTAVIEGSITPAAGVLEFGERREVAYTQHIADLVEQGWVILIELRDAEDTNPADDSVDPVPDEPVVEEAVIEEPAVADPAPKSRRGSSGG